MATTTQTKGLIIEEGRTKLIAQHLDRELVFIYPAIGPDTYFNVGRQIKANGLSRATASETASLIHGAWNSGNKYSKEIKIIMESSWMWWGFTGNLYVPNEGVYIEDNPKIKGNSIIMNKNNLAKRLKEDDPSVRFVKFGYKTGIQTSLELVKNPYIIGLFGEQGAEKLAEVADVHKRNPYVYSFSNVDKKIKRVVSLCSYWDEIRFGVIGNDLGCDVDGYAFGVDKTGESSRA